MNPNRAEEICLSCGLVCTTGMSFQEVNGYKISNRDETGRTTSFTNNEDILELI